MGGKQMVKIIKNGNSNKDGISIISIAKGEIFFVSHLVPGGIEGLAEIKKVENSFSTKITAKTEIVLTVEGLHDSGKGCKHIRFMREARRGQLIRVDVAKFWPRLRAALNHAKLPPVHAPGGFGFALRYEDERAVPNYTMDGASGWIIFRKDIGKYLDALPPLEDSREIVSIWIETVGYMTTSERNLGIFDHNPIEETPLEYRDVGRWIWTSSNRQIVRVEYDKGSKLVNRIIDEQDGENHSCWTCQIDPELRDVEVGKRIPRCCVFE